MAEDIVESFGFKAESYRQAKAKTEPQAEIKGSKRLLKGSDEPQTKRPIQCYECRAWHRCFKEKPSYNMIKSRCPIDEPQTEREGE